MAAPLLDPYLATIFYDALGHTGNTYYVRYVRHGDGKYWDNVNEVMSDTAAWALSAVTLTEKGSTGEFPVITPAILPTGSVYDIVVYLQSGSSPQQTDDVEETVILKHGGVMGF